MTERSNLSALQSASEPLTQEGTELRDRLRQTLFQRTESLQLNPSISLPVRTPGHIEPSSVRQLIELVAGDQLDDRSIVGWYAGESDYSRQIATLGQPLDRITLAAGTDLDWLIWKSSAARALDLVSETFPSLGLNLVIRRGRTEWALLCGPTDDAAHLYPLANQ